MAPGDEVVEREDAIFHCKGCVLKIKIPKATVKKANKAGKRSRNGKRKAETSAQKRTEMVEAKDEKMDTQTGPEEREDEEERWMKAVDCGEMPAMDPEVKAVKDPKTMTARQRALMEGSTKGIPLEECGHMALGEGKRNTKKTTEEEEEDNHAKRTKEIMAKKRKEMGMKKREEDKKRTMDKLLEKKESKQVKQQQQSASAVKKEDRVDVAKFVYKITRHGSVIEVPEGFEFPFVAQGPVAAPPERSRCSVKGCGKDKSYCCSKTGRPLCSSIECYKRNLVEIHV